MTDSRETGFGAPDDGGLDLGFGSPDDGALGGDTGFGSPSNLTGARPSQSVVSDDGGEIITLQGDFSGYAGPYRLYVLVGGEELPCYGATTGRGYDCFPVDASTMEFATPPAPPGTYALKIVGAVEETVAAALTYVTRIHKHRVFTTRQRWPADSMFAGLHALSDEPWSFDYDLPAVLRAELVKAVGEELDAITGPRMTRLTADFAPGDTTLPVESTYGLPDAGTVYCDGLDTPRLVYTGRTATSLTGVARSPYERRTAGRGAVVSEAEGDAAHVDRAMNELYLVRATGAALDRLATAVVGLPRPPWMSDEAYRETALAIAWLACGTWSAVWKVCEAWLLDFTHEATVTIAGQEITDATAGFANHHVGRFVRVYDGETSAVHRIVDRAGDSVTLAAYDGPFWAGASYSSGERRYRLLPFWIEHDADALGSMPGLVRVHAAVTGLHAPATYLQAPEEADYAAVTPPALTAGGGVDLEQEPGAAGDGYRGFMLEDADADGTALYPDVPIYLYDPTIPDLQRLLEDVVAAWCRVEVVTMPP